MNSVIAYLFTQPFPLQNSVLYKSFPENCLLIGVDGGTHILDELGRRPDLIIGDMDSITEDLLYKYENQTTILRYPTEKDETDCELAIQWCIEHNITEIRIINALTGRIDHILGMLQNLLYARRKGLKAEILSDNQRLFFSDGKTILQEHIGTKVSLIPFSYTVKGVSTEGLKYPLMNEELHQELSRGISNEIICNPASITLKEGDLLVIVTQ